MLQALIAPVPALRSVSRLGVCAVRRRQGDGSRLVADRGPVVGRGGPAAAPHREASGCGVRVVLGRHVLGHCAGWCTGCGGESVGGRGERGQVDIRLAVWIGTSPARREADGSDWSVVRVLCG